MLRTVHPGPPVCTGFVQVGDTEERMQVTMDSEGASHLDERLSLTADATGGQIRAADDSPLARVVANRQDPSALDVLDPQGVAIFRMRQRGTEMVIRDRAGVPTVTVAQSGGRFVAKERDGAVSAFVTGTDDVALATMLVAEAADIEQRLLLSCTHLLRNKP